MTIKVLDAICGQGKTTKVLSNIEELPLNVKVIYVTLLITECERVIEHFSNSKCGRKFVMPLVMDSSGSKMLNLLTLLKSGGNIATTHALFRNLTPEHLELIYELGYNLVLDEVLTVVETFKELKGLRYTVNHIKELVEEGVMVLDSDDCTLRWDSSKLRADESFYKSLKDLCAVGSLLIIEDKCVLWSLPVDVLKVFNEITICTYMFESSDMAAYLKYHGMSYEVNSFGVLPSEFKDFIDIFDRDTLNNIGDKNSALSASKIRLNEGGCVPALKKCLYNYFNHHNKGVKSDRKLWTGYKSKEHQLKGLGYATRFLACNTKATNEYGNTKVLAYTCNIHHQPYIAKFYKAKGIKLNQDLYTLSEMLQWLWRSQIRNNKPIKVYIPSSRMRNLLKAWLEDTYI